MLYTSCPRNDRTQCISYPFLSWTPNAVSSPLQCILGGIRQPLRQSYRNHRFVIVCNQISILQLEEIVADKF